MPFNSAHLRAFHRFHALIQHGKLMAIILDTFALMFHVQWTLFMIWINSYEQRYSADFWYDSWKDSLMKRKKKMTIKSCQFNWSAFYRPICMDMLQYKPNSEPPPLYSSLLATGLSQLNMDQLKSAMNFIAIFIHTSHLIDN